MSSRGREGEVLNSSRQRQKPLSRETAKTIFMELVESGELQVKAPLSERALAERMGLSRTPVREALQELALEGIVTLNRSRGAFINSISLDELRDLYEVRLSLETVAAYRAAKSGDLGELAGFVAEFESIDRALAASDGFKAAQTLGEALHTSIVAAASNDYLRSIYRGLRSRIQFSRLMTRDYGPKRVIEAHKEHMHILGLILSRDASTAQKAMESHLRKSFETRALMFTELPPITRTPLETG